MHRIFVLWLAAIASLAAPVAYAQPPAGGLRLDPVPPARGEQLVVHPGDADSEQWVRAFGQTWVRNVDRPTLYPVRPRDGHGNGRAIIVVPGGGYQFVSIDNEGFRVAERLAAEGYTAFVLKYRVQPTPRDDAGFGAALARQFGALGKAALPGFPPAVDDLATAISLVREQAAKFDVDPARIGVVGFSAGSRSTIALLETRSDVAGLLSNIALIYPPTMHEIAGGPRPPLFVAIAADDPLFRQGGLALPAAWLKQSQNLEFHLYSGGGHGFGMIPKGTSSDGWIADYLRWLSLR